MSFGVSDGGDFEYNGSSPNGLFAKRAHLVTPWFHRMIADLVRFNGNAQEAAARRAAQDRRSGHWLDEGGYSRAFVERLIVPQASAVWSADPRQMWTFPARFLVEFFANHGMLGFAKRPQWRTVVGGSRSYVDAVIKPWRDRLRLNTPVTAITRDEDGVSVTPRGGEPERFDEVVLATHSDQALSMLADATDREHEILGAIPLSAQRGRAAHGPRLLPRRRRAWASWNYHLLPEPTGMTTVTYHMNRLQALQADREFCVTLNRSEAIDPARSCARSPTRTRSSPPKAPVAQARHHEIAGRNRTHYAGAYWRWGFHEDGVVSAVRVGEHFGARL